MKHPTPKRSAAVWVLDRRGTPPRLIALDEHTRTAVTVQRGRGDSQPEQFVAQLVQEYGLPRAIKTDYGCEFLSSSSRAWLSQRGIEHVISRPTATHHWDRIGPAMPSRQRNRRPQSKG
jgi:transposase InsO family protein